MTAQLEASDRNTLKSLVRGAVHFPDDDRYDETRQVRNGMIDRRPAAIIDAAGVADVMATVRFARERGLPIAVRCGGHNVAGNAVGERLAAIKAQYDPARPPIIIQMRCNSSHKLIFNDAFSDAP